MLMALAPSHNPETIASVQWQRRRPAARTHRLDRRDSKEPLPSETADFSLVARSPLARSPPHRDGGRLVELKIWLWHCVLNLHISCTRLLIAELLKVDLGEGSILGVHLNARLRVVAFFTIADRQQ